MHQIQQPRDWLHTAALDRLSRPAGYESARQEFLALAHALGASVRSYPLASPTGASFFIDAASLGTRSESSPQLIVTSGLHGVEGYAGSRVQCEWMRQLMERSFMPDERSLLLVHGLNPWGFAQHRRWNEEGVDLNRNFLLPHETYEGCDPAYRALEDFINPKDRPRAMDNFWWQAPLALSRYGLSSLNRAIAEGQYAFPKGLFFGGSQPCAQRELIDLLFRATAPTPSRCWHIDLHTGLGSYAEVQLFLETESSRETLAHLRQALHPRRLRAGEELVFKAPGNLGRYLQHHLGPSFQSLTLEMGTLPAPTLFRLLRRENQAHHTLGADHEETAAARAKVFEAFAPEDSSWWRLVIPKAVRTLGDAWDTFKPR